jgi:flagellar motility protein MotE (MotC chaperone)
MTGKEKVEAGTDIVKRKSLSITLRIFFISILTVTFTCLSFAQDQKQQQSQQGSLEKERLSIIRSDIQKEIEYNEKLKKEIEDAQKGVDEAARQRLLKVSKIYEAMPVEEAAKTLEKLDEDTAVAILGTLKPRSAGGILAQMDSDKAASISKKLITRKQR